jgi:hypothetical protein
VNQKLKEIINNIKNIDDIYQKSISRKPLKYIFDFLPHNILLLILFVFALSLFIPQIINNRAVFWHSGQQETIVGEIVSKPVIQKNFGYF